MSKAPPAVQNVCASNSSIEDRNSPVHLIGQENGLLSFFTYELDGLPDKEPWTAREGSRIIRGNEKFLVLLVEKGYVVLCYDKDVVLPSVQLSIEALAYML